MRRSQRADDEADLAWCHDALQDVSRTFSLTVDTLEDPMASQICLGYLLCRIPDTIEDASHIQPSDQSDLLSSYSRALDPASDGTIEEFTAAARPWIEAADPESDDWRVVAEASRVKATFSKLPDDVRAAITPPVLELVDGLSMFVERHQDAGGIRIEDREELEEYCYYAAGTVGTLITNLLDRDDLESARRETLYETAGSFGQLFQLVNVAKDIYGDYTEENNVYIPATWLAEANVPQESVIEPEYRDAAAAVVSRTASHAETFLDEAESYLRTMPLTGGNTLPAWGVPFLLAVGTLRELGKRPAGPLTDREVKVSREEVYAIVETMQRVDSDAISELRSVIAHRPLHEASTPVSSD